MTDTSQINCPGCNSSMNHHAVKLEYDSDDPPDPEFEGVLKNVHTCPDCGAVEIITAA